MKDRERDIRREALQLVFAEENAKCTSIMMKRFKQIDEKNTGHIQIKHLREAMCSCALLTPKEVNLIIRSINPEQKTYEYKEFGNLLFEVRYELARSRIMDTSLDKMTDNMVLEFAVHDTKKDGSITITQAKKALFSSKHTTLTPMQVFTLIGMSKPDPNGFLNYREFAKTCHQAIDELFSMKSLTEKAALIESRQFKPPANIEDI